jgi:hypothetical protein
MSSILRTEASPLCCHRRQSRLLSKTKSFQVQLQPELARLSTHGKQIVAESSREMPTEHPKVVISAIHEVWLAARVYCSRVHHGQLGS